MAKINHSRPELRYKDGLDKVRKQFVAAAKRLEVPAEAGAEASSVVDSGVYHLTPEQTRIAAAMLVAGTDYLDKVTAQMQVVVSGTRKIQARREAAANNAKVTFEARVRDYLIMMVEDGLKPKKQQSAGLKAFGKKVQKQLNASPEINAVFVSAFNHLEAARVAAKAITAPSLKQKPS